MALPSAATNLRKTLQDPKGFIVAPGVYDGMSARLALAAGFDALYMVCAIPHTHTHRSQASQANKVHHRQAQEQQPQSTAKQT